LSRPRLQPPRASVLLAAAMILLAANLRPAAAAIGPLLGRIQHDTGLSGFGAGLLTTLPVLCFGALAPLAPTLARRLGERTTVAVALAVLLLGLLVRLVPGIGFLFLGTALAGAAIAIGNVLLPVLVRGNFPDRIGLLTGLYTTSLVGFAALAAGISVPVANAFGGGWRPGLGIWAVPAAIALAVWAPELRCRQRAARPAGHRVAGARALLRDRVAWSVTLFFAVQSAGFYATLAWLPSVFHSHGLSTTKSGLLLSLSLVAGLVPALTLPTLAARAHDQRRFVLAVVGCILVGWLGVLFDATGAPYLWAILLGVGQNAAFPLALTMIVLRGGSLTNTAGLSTLVQTVGYLVAALGPLAIGAVHELTGSWTPSLLVLIGLLVPQLLLGLAAARNRTVTPAVG